MAEDQEWCNAKDLAALFDLTLPRIYQLVKDGILEKHGVGKFDRDASVGAYCRYMRGVIKQQGSGSSNAELKKSRVDLLKTQRKNAELAYQEKTRKLLKIDDVEALLMESAAVYAGQKRSMGSRLAGMLAGMDDPKAILDLLNVENDAILQNTADKFSAIAGVGKGSGHSETAAKPNAKRVGGRKPGTPARKPGAGTVAK